jgi:hypothetical protein
MIVDLFMVYQFMKRLIKPFDTWDAYKLGIIDGKGNILKHQKDLAREEERAAFGKFDLLVLNLKKALEKVPGGRLATKAALLYLLKEGDAEFDQSLFESYILEVEGSGVPSTNTSAIPASEPKPKSPVLKRKGNRTE